MPFPTLFIIVHGLRWALLVISFTAAIVHCVFEVSSVDNSNFTPFQSGPTSNMDLILPLFFAFVLYLMVCVRPELPGEPDEGWKITWPPGHTSTSNGLAGPRRTSGLHVAEPATYPVMEGAQGIYARTVSKFERSRIVRPVIVVALAGFILYKNMVMLEILDLYSALKDAQDLFPGTICSDVPTSQGRQMCSLYQAAGWMGVLTALVALIEVWMTDKYEAERVPR